MPNRPKRVTGFPAVVNERCVLLILGTLPGTIALSRQEYYGNPLNHFWLMIMRLSGGRPEWEYSRRLLWLLKKGVALWDVYESGLRQGALDSAIREPKVNNFTAFFKIYPRIQHVFCNGQESYRAFVAHGGHSHKNIVYLPSSSPAFAKSLDWKIRQWGRLLGETFKRALK